MPWNVTRDTNLCPASKPFAVTKEGTGALVACHATKEGAVQQQRALYASMPASEQRASDRPWGSFTQADYTPEQWQRACLVDTGQGDANSKDRFKMPVREPSGALNVNGVHAAAARCNQLQPASLRAGAARKLISLYRELGEEPPPSLTVMASSRAADEFSPVFTRTGSAVLEGVNFDQRVITVLAVPYEDPTPVMYRGDVWHEVFSRSAFLGMKMRQDRMGRIPVTSLLNVPNPAGHLGAQLVGRVVKLEPEHNDGLHAEMRISKTSVGDDTLEMAADGTLGPSIGFLCRGSDEQLDRRSMTRRVNNAILDHIALVGQPAYENAAVLSVRSVTDGDDLPRLDTPNMDSVRYDPELAKASERLARRAEQE